MTMKAIREQEGRVNERLPSSRKRGGVPGAECSPTVAARTGTNRDEPGSRPQRNRGEALVSPRFTPGNAEIYVMNANAASDAGADWSPLRWPSPDRTAPVEGSIPSRRTNLSSGLSPSCGRKYGINRAHTHGHLRRDHRPRRVSA